jgi:ribosomal protein S18 acetylase RimI-like enzyme
MNAAAVRIRKADAADAAALARLSGELGYATEVAQMTRRLARVLADDEHRVFVAEAEEGGAVMGWLQVHLTKIIESEPRGEIVGLVVSADVRGRGIGRKLVEAAEAWAKEQGAESVGVRCNTTRAEAHAFYERLGFRAAKTQISFRKGI